MSNPSTTTRRGLTLIETLVVVFIISLLLALLIPVMLMAIERARRLHCAANLQQVGLALLSYHTDHERFPPAVRFAEDQSVPWSSTWWLDVMPYVELKQIKKKWQSFPGDGNFNGVFANANIEVVDGFDPKFLSCPASTLPRFTDPGELSDLTAALVKPGPPRGIFVPSYAAVSGSAPDMRGLTTLAELENRSHGRNTRDERYGILSGSGVFPPYGQTSLAAIQMHDGTGQVMMVVEQSGWTVDRSAEPAVWYDQRSSWPRGMFSGAEQMYGMLSPEAEGIDGSGDARVACCTTIRYAPNTRGLESGIVMAPRSLPPPPQPGEPPRPRQRHPRGPGHNQGIFSAHVGAAHALFADGRVELLSDAIDLPILLQLSTIDDGEVVKEH